MNLKVAIFFYYISGLICGVISLTRVALKAPKLWEAFLTQTELNMSSAVSTLS